MKLFQRSAIEGVKGVLDLHPAMQKTSQGIGNPDNRRNSRTTIKVRGFFHGEHENAQHGQFLTGCVGTSQDVPVPIAGFPTRHSLQPSIGKEGSRVSTCQSEATMPNFTSGNTAQITPISSGKSQTNVNAYQNAIEAISRAHVLLASGQPQIALGQLMTATRGLQRALAASKVGSAS
ncbi:MAG: hypothetical protein WCK63_14865 [Betaproteobacteria bacterium]